MSVKLSVSIIGCCVRKSLPAESIAPHSGDGGCAPNPKKDRDEIYKYKKGIIDTIIMRVIDIGLGIPEFVLMIAFASFFKPSIWNLVIAITILNWMTYTRVTRAIVNTEMSKHYIQLARVRVECNVYSFQYLQ